MARPLHPVPAVAAEERVAAVAAVVQLRKARRQRRTRRAAKMRPHGARGLYRPRPEALRMPRRPAAAGVAGPLVEPLLLGASPIGQAMAHILHEFL